MEFRQMFSVLAVFALLGGALFTLRRGSLGSLKLRTVRWGSPRWSLRRFARAPATGKSLETMERLALTPQHALHLVRIQGREVVVATHPHGCTVLSNGCTVVSDDRASLSGELNNGLNGGLSGGSNDAKDERSWSNTDRILMKDGRAVSNALAEGLRS